MVLFFVNEIPNYTHTGGTVYDLSSPVAPLQTMAPAPAPVAAPTQEPAPTSAPAPAPATLYTTEPTVSDLLAASRLSQYLAGLTTLGVESVEDMKELGPEDFELEVVSTQAAPIPSFPGRSLRDCLWSQGMKKVEVKRLIRHLKSNSGAE